MLLMYLWYGAGGAITTGTSNVLIGSSAGDALTVHTICCYREGALTADVLEQSVANGTL